LDLPAERLRLPVLAVPAAVEPDFRHQERPVAGKYLKPGKVRSEPRLRLEVYVEASQVEERQIQILGGWVVDVAHEALGVLGFGDPVELLEEALHPPGPVPAHNRSGDLVGERIA